MSGAPADGRPSAASRGYGHKWRKARETYLARNPLCVMCSALGRTTPATVVDHIRPHKGDQSVFWDRANWQALCAPCHDRHKQAEDRGGMASGCDVNGVPISKSHHWTGGGQK